jgi:hypothetical protein
MFRSSLDCRDQAVDIAQVDIVLGEGDLYPCAG